MSWRVKIGGQRLYGTCGVSAKGAPSPAYAPVRVRGVFHTGSDWLKDKPYPVVDVQEAFRADSTQSKGDFQTYLARYYVSPRGGHHSPGGSFFVATAVLNRVSKWLNLVPLPNQ